MHANSRIKRGMPVGETNPNFKVRRTVARSDRHHVFDARVDRASNHRVAIGVELVAIQVAMRIDQFHVFILA